MNDQTNTGVAGTDATDPLAIARSNAAIMRAEQDAHFLAMQEQDTIRFKRDARSQALGMAVRQCGRSAGKADVEDVVKYADDIYNWLTADL